mgnify:FL=1
MGKDMKEGKMSDEDVKKRVGYTSDENRQKRLDKIKVKFMKKEETEVKEGIRDLDQEKGTKERKASLEKKRGMKLDDHPQYKKEEVESEGYMPMTPERTARVDKSKAKAYDKDMMAQSKGDTKGADKQFKRRMAMDSKTKMKKEEVVNEALPAIIPAAGAVLAKGAMVAGKALAGGAKVVGKSAVKGAAMGAQQGAQDRVRRAVSGNNQQQESVFSQDELDRIEEIVNSWVD